MTAFQIGSFGLSAAGFFLTFVALVLGGRKRDSRPRKALRVGSAILFFAVGVGSCTLGAAGFWLSQEASVTVHVTDSAGAALERAKVLLFLEGSPQVEFADTNGVAEFTVAYSAPTQARLIVESAGYEIHEQTIQIPRDQTLQVQVSRTAGDLRSVIAQVVDDTSGTPVRGAEVILIAGGQVYSQLADSHGLVKFTLPFQAAALEAQLSVQTRDYDVEHVLISLVPDTVQRIGLNPLSGDLRLGQFDSRGTGTVSAATGESVDTPERAIGSLPPPGWPMEDDSVQLNLLGAEIRTDDDYERAAARLWFVVLNKAPREQLIEIDHGDIYILDIAGTKYVDWEGSGDQSFSLNPGQFKIIDREYSVAPDQRSRISPSLLPLTIVVEEVSTLRDAKWQVGGLPVPTYREGDPVGASGDAMPIGQLELTLTSLDIRTSSSYEPAAFRAFFKVENLSSEERLLEIDHAHLFIEDSYGNRYFDWEGAGISSVLLGPREDFTFDRYFTSNYDERTRLPSGASYVVVICGCVPDAPVAQWRVDIAR